MQLHTQVCLLLVRLMNGEPRAEATESMSYGEIQWRAWKLPGPNVPIPSLHAACRPVRWMTPWRAFLAALAVVFVAWPLVASGQQAGKPIRIGILTAQSRETSTASWESFRQGLRHLGWENGRNLIIEERFTDGNFDRLQVSAQELLKLNVTLIVAANSPGASAAISATKTVPIVMVEVGDPVATGFVTNLARPGGNVTGVSNIASDLTQKRLALLKEAVPRASRIAVIMNPDDPIIPMQWRDAEAGAGRLGVQLLRLEIRNVDDLRRVFEVAAKGKADAILRLADPLAGMLNPETVELAMKYRLPTMVRSRLDVEAGGLMSYFPDPRDYYRQAASHVDKILKGAKPGDLPIEQPTRIELVINLKTAKALGLTIPQSLLGRADAIIQ